MNKDIFKSYDIRGKVGSELNEEVLTNIGRAMADWLPKEGPVAVGYDMRPDSAGFAKAITKGLTMQGRDVWDIGQVTSDMIYFAVGDNNLAGGAMITASHNPGDYNGIKLCHELARPIGEQSGLFKIRDNILANKYKPAAKKAGKVTKKDLSEGWIDHTLGFIDANKLKPLKIAVDAGNGMAGKIFPELEPYVPFEVTEMYFELDGTFPNHIANPLIPENLADVIKMVKSKKLDAGVAFDGDGDRAVLIDENGQPLSGTVMTAILADYFSSGTKGATILHNLLCGDIVPKVIEKNGAKAVRTKVGHSNIKADMAKHDGLFAGEHSGHYFFKDNWNADSGLIAAVIALHVLSLSGKKLSELADEYRKSFAIDETNFEIEDKKKAMQDIATAFPEAKQDWLDGLSLRFDDGWVNIRPSNTEPLLRLNAESSSKISLGKRVTAVTKLLKSE